MSVLAAALVLLVLNIPDRLSGFTLGAMLRPPLEAVVIVLLLLVLRGRARRIAAIAVAVLLGLSLILRLIDIGFHETLDRAFDPVTDWPLLTDAVEALRRSIGTVPAIAAVLALVTVVIGLCYLLARSMLRLAPLLTGRATAAIVCVLLVLQVVSGLPLTSTTTATYAWDKARQVREGLGDRDEFAAENAADRFRNTPSSQLLTGLRGKDVVLAFVESYGAVALSDPQVTSALDKGDKALRSAGFATRSAWLTSPTAGGGSWLAHSTLLSGVWIDNQQRYTSLLASDRLTLPKAFHRAGWRTSCIMPAVTQPWPEGQAFYGFDRLYLTDELGYRGPRFSFDSIPDQFTLSAYHRLERTAPDHAPVMTELALMSSHGPWSPVPSLVGWDQLGDGSLFGGMPTAPWDGPKQAYGRAVAYSLGSLLSYMEHYGDPGTVFVFLGDHQPAPLVTGENAIRDVPITIAARDPKVLDRIASWGWQDGVRPSAQAPAWPMHSFRDRFLEAFS